MTTFEPGEKVKVEVKVQAGAFADERLINIDTVNGVVSGFVNASDIENREGEIGYIEGEVKSTTDNTITVFIKGSFFTTNGLT